LGRFWNSLFGEDDSQFWRLFKPQYSRRTGRTGILQVNRFQIPDAGGYISGLRAFYELVDNGGMSGRALFNPVGYFKTWNTRFHQAS
jgi:hypothetical protein